MVEHTDNSTDISASSVNVDTVEHDNHNGTIPTTANSDQQPIKDTQIDIDNLSKKSKHCPTAQFYCPEPSPLVDIDPLKATLQNYLNPLIWNVARKRALQMTDIWELTDYDCTNTVHDNLNKQWLIQRDIAKQRNTTPSLPKALWHTYGLLMIRSGMSESGYYALMCTQPFLIKYTVDYLQSGETATLAGTPYSIWYCLGLVGTIFFGSFFLAGKFWINYRYSNQVRLALMSLIYNKSLKLSTSARATASMGEVVNVMSNDTSRVGDAFLLGQTIVICPAVLCIVSGLIIWQVGVPAIAAMLVMISMLPLQAMIGRKIQQNRRGMLKYADERVKLMSEILTGIRVIKSYAWEQPMAERVNAARDKEVNKVGYSLLYKAINMSLLFILPVLATFFTFIWYTYVYGRPPLIQIFTTLAFLNVVRFPLSLLPNAISTIADARIALNRIQSFLLLDELHVHTNNQSHTVSEHTTPGTIELRNASFSWSYDTIVTQPILSNINILIRPGELVGIIGSVASGKSSLLSAILNEMIPSDTSYINLQGTCSYTSQRAWIRNQSIQDNILCGLEYNEYAYINAIDAAALTADLAIMPAADLTEIGEQGLNLSGGQKARVAMARAIYRSNITDIYLFDDPLAAVDMHVGVHIFDKCINGVLKPKTRVLVMNSHLHLLSQFDRIIVLENGTIADIGSYNDIQTKYSHLIPLDDDTDDKTNEISVSQIEKPTHTRQLTAPKQTTSEIVHSTKKEKNAALIQVEDRKEGAVAWKTWFDYGVASSPQYKFGSIINGTIILSLYSACQALQILANYWLSFFGADSVQPYQHSDAYWLGSYAGLVTACLVGLAIRSAFFVLSNMRASRYLHNTLFENLLHAPTSTFFDVTPVGRILNRFSSDLDKIDLLLPDNLGSMSQYTFLILGIIITSALASPYFLAIFVPILGIFYFTQALYRNASRELKRLDGVSRSPIYSLFSETLSGLPTIRACNLQQELRNEFFAYCDANGKVSLISNLCERWLSIRVEFISAAMVLVTTLLVCTISSSIPVSRLGIALIYALQMQGVLQIAIRMSIVVETSLTSVERLLQYSTIETEAPPIIQNEYTPPPEWPQKGMIQFHNVKLRYRPELDLVLKGVNLDVHSNEKIGVCGRTGSGKSTLMLALFRLIELAEGTITIDGIDISKIGLQQLRSKLGIIPQDAVVFSGTVRYNLDPFDVYSDEQIWEALDRSSLTEAVKSMPGRLNAVIADEGANISHGQRQLLCIARALLRQAKILVLDEATASIDQETDHLLQSTIRNNFTQSTILTIAHRLETIIDYNRVVVMKSGELVEADTPAQLLRNGLQGQTSLFYDMISQSGESNVHKMLSIAEQSEENVKLGNSALLQQDELVRQLSGETEVLNG